VELQVILLQQIIRDGKSNLEPMRSPAGTEPLADMGWFELVGDGVFERGTREVGRGIELQLDPFVASCTAFVELTTSKPTVSTAI
jgi:hypothetical protein